MMIIIMIIMMITYDVYFVLKMFLKNDNDNDNENENVIDISSVQGGGADIKQ